jgi:hypothetical protein
MEITREGVGNLVLLALEPLGVVKDLAVGEEFSSGSGR